MFKTFTYCQIWMFYEIFKEMKEEVKLLFTFSTGLKSNDKMQVIWRIRGIRSLGNPNSSDLH